MNSLLASLTGATAWIFVTFVRWLCSFAYTTLI